MGGRGRNTQVSEPKSDYQAAIEEELHSMLTANQIATLTSLLREIIQNKYGALTIRIEGDTLYLEKSISLKAGRLPNS
jgi:hypothetical protein